MDGNYYVIDRPDPGFYLCQKVEQKRLPLEEEVSTMVTQTKINIPNEIAFTQPVLYP